MKTLEIGQAAHKSRTFFEEDVQRYVRLTGDENPLYTSAEARAQAGLRAPIVPGPLIGGLFSDLLGTELPGRGTNWMKQRFRFVRPARVGERVFAKVQVVRLRPEKDLVNLLTVCVGEGGDPICEGEALVMAREMV